MRKDIIISLEVPEELLGNPTLLRDWLRRTSRTLCDQIATGLLRPVVRSIELDDQVDVTQPITRDPDRDLSI